MIVVLFLGKTKLYGEAWEIEDSPIMNRSFAANTAEKAPENMSLVQAFVPYFVLSILTLVVLTVTPISNFLNQVSFGISFPETMTGYGHVNAASMATFKPFTHASMFLLISALAGLFYYKGKGWIGEGGVKRIFMKSITMTMPSGISVIGLVIMSKIMDGTGQTAVLAEGIANVLGKVYVILAPFVGMLGTFMTGSNMSSNILFGGFQVTTANLLGVEASPVLGAQSAGGAIGSAISPSKIILGTTTANILGSEGEVLKKLMALAITCTIAIGLIAFVFVAL
jgi:lactate permease